jgi:hypothetical protein
MNNVRCFKMVIGRKVYPYFSNVKCRDICIMNDTSDGFRVVEGIAFVERGLGSLRDFLCWEACGNRPVLQYELA